MTGIRAAFQQGSSICKWSNREVFYFCCWGFLSFVVVAVPERLQFQYGTSKHNSE